jgi:peptide deformylase
VIKITYFDESWNKKTEEYDNMRARVIQHEFDHIDGKLFVDYLSPLKRKLLKNKLSEIMKGKVDVAYKVKKT